MKHWTHAHSIGVGLFGGLLLVQHLLWIVTICLLIGFLVGRLYGGLVGIGQAALARLNPVKAKMRRQTPDDGIPY